MRFMFRGFLMLGIFLMSVSAFAQTPPPEFDVALNALNDELGTSLTIADLDNYSWEEFQYNDSSLGCPQPDMGYLQVITNGYQVILIYQGISYDYRVQTGTSNAFLCSSSDAPVTSNPVPVTVLTPTAPQLDVLAVTNQPIDASNALAVEIFSEQAFVKTIVWSPDSTLMALASSVDDVVWLYNMQDMTQAPLMINVDAPATALAFTVDSQMLLIGDELGTLYFWDLATNTLINQFSAHTVAITTINVSPDGHYLVTVGADNFARFYGIADN